MSRTETLEPAAARTPRKSSKLFLMLERLAAGQNIIPKTTSNCIIFDIEKDPQKVDATFFDNRINAFKAFIEDFFWMDMEVVGVSNHCIRVYLRPLEYDAELRERVVQWINVPIFHREMKRCEIDRAFFYGVTLVVE